MQYDAWKLDCPPEYDKDDYLIERDIYREEMEDFFEDYFQVDYDEEPWEEDLNPYTEEDLKYLN